MAIDYTVQGLLASIRRRAMMPTATATGTADADLTALANEEMSSWLAPLILSLREEYLVQRESQTTVAGTAAYRIPHRALGAKLREVEIVESSGEVRNLIRIGPDELSEYPQGSNGTPSAFYLQGGNVVLVPTPSGAETLRLTYYARPNELSSTYKSISSATSTIITSSAHGYTTSSVLDIIKGTSPFEVVASGVSPSAYDANTLTFASGTYPTHVGSGDYIVTQLTSPVPNVPAEFHPLLAQRVAVKLFEAQGDDAALRRASAVLAEMEANVRETFAPRVDGEAKIVAPGSDGLMGGIFYRGDW